MLSKKTLCTYLKLPRPSNNDRSWANTRVPAERRTHEALIGYVGLLVSSTLSYGGARSQDHLIGIVVHGPLEGISRFPGGFVCVDIGRGDRPYRRSLAAHVERSVPRRPRNSKYEKL
eukprot:1388029-Amorphochlora_amoeboformis.AAC.3